MRMRLHPKEDPLNLPYAEPTGGRGNIVHAVLHLSLGRGRYRQNSISVDGAPDMGFAWPRANLDMKWMSGVTVRPRHEATYSGN